MASTTTSRYGLVKPTAGTAEPVNVTTQLDDNWDKVDLNLGARVCTSSTRPGAPIAGMMIWETDKLALRVYDAVNSKWKLVNPITAQASITTAESSASTTYVDLTTVGPAVTLYMTAGQKAFIYVKARQVVSAAGANSPHMSWAVSGTETVAAADADDNESVNNVQVADATYVALGTFTASAVDGDRTFTAKYRVTGAVTGTWRNRRIIVDLKD